MRIYELALVLKPSLSAVQRKKIVTTIKNSLKPAHNVSVASGELKLKDEKEIGERPLTYKIKKENIGYYMDLVFEGEAVIPVNFEKKMLTDENVLRHLLIRRK